MPMPLKKPFRLSAAQIMVLGFAGVVLLGAGLLMLPISSAGGVVTPFVDALFTATTSVCVTGLVVVDTGSYWSTFGQFIILFLIQIGGLGVVTVAACFAIISGRRIGLFQRSTLQEAVAAPQLGGIVKLTGFIVRGTFLVEGIGALLLAPWMILDFGWLRGIWMAIFTSVSAFCNAGIDLMGITAPFSSMTAYAGNPFVNFTLMALIVVGGLGFLTWDDVRNHGIHLRRYRMQSKVILLTSLLLILIPAVGFFLLEWNELPLGQRALAALFHSVSVRTAGFSTADLTALTDPGKVVTVLLMLVGGSPGSTAGGMKTTTLAVLIGCAFAVFRKRQSVQFFGRRIGEDVVFTAATLALLYGSLSLGGAVFLSFYEGLPFLTCLFETASAVATVGLSLGVTPQLSLISKLILILLMFLGRVGGLTLIYAALSGQRQVGKLPLDRITVG